MPSSSCCAKSQGCLGAMLQELRHSECQTKVCIEILQHEFLKLFSKVFVFWGFFCNLF